MWAKCNTGGGGVSNGVITDTKNNVIIVGYFSSNYLVFETDTLVNVNSNKSDIFIAKFNQDGNFIWAKCAGGIGNDYGNDISTDLNDNIIITGNFGSQTIIFGTDTLVNAGVRDIFISKYDFGGNVLWAKCAGGNDSDGGNGVATDKNNNIYITGGFGSTYIVFGSDTLINNNDSHGDIFLAKFDSNGNDLWAKSAGGFLQDAGGSITSDVDNNIIFTGSFQSEYIIFGTDTLFSSGSIYSNIFIVKYDTIGNVLWAKGTGDGGTYNNSNGIAVDGINNTIIAGGFWSPTLTFGTDILVNSSNHYDIFVAKLSSCANINENIYKTGLIIYPNPASDKIFLNLNQSQEIKNGIITVYSIQGQLIFKQSILQQYPNSIDISKLATGVYFITLEDGRNKSAGKFIKH